METEIYHLLIKINNEMCWVSHRSHIAFFMILLAGLLLLTLIKLILNMDKEFPSK